MAALLKGIRPRLSKRRGPTNYRVTDAGRNYRVCAEGGHVLLIGLKHKRDETLLNHGTRRYRQIARLAAAEYGVELRF